MKFSDILETFETLDRSFGDIEEEHRGLRGAATFPTWESIVRERPRRAAGVAAGELLCAQHGGAPHGMPHDGFTDHLASELSEWVRIAEYSPTARSILGIDRVAMEPGARVGAMVYLDETRELRARFSASGGSVVPAQAGRRMWADEAQKNIGFRGRAARDEPFLLFSNEGGKGRRWSFSDVRKGYEEYLKAAGKRADEAAGSALWTCPTPRLLGGLSDHNLRNAGERVPLAVSEAWLADAGGAAQAGHLASSCEACRFGLSAWMCGHGDMLRRASAPGPLDYAGEAHEWAERLRARPKPQSAPQKKSAVVAAMPGTGAGDRGAAAAQPAPAQTAASQTAAAQPAPAQTAAAQTAAAQTATAQTAAAQTAAAQTAAAQAAAAQTAAAQTAAAQAAGVAFQAAGAAMPAAASATGVGEAAAALGAGAAQKNPRLEHRGVAMLDLPERDVTGTEHRLQQKLLRDFVDAPVDIFAEARRRDRVRVRLESAEFSCDEVEIRELTGTEAISRLFSFHVHIVCFEAGGLATSQMLGAGVAIVFEQGNVEVRRVHGMVAEVSDLLETESEWRSYRLWIVPRVWRSTLVETQELYLDISVPDLIQQKLALVGLTGEDVEMRLMGSYPARELIVQYKETDVAFISRLAEHLGICFFFEHDGGRDKIVFSDENSGFRPLPGGAVLDYRPRGEASDVFELTARARAFPASYAMQDYNYRTPKVELTKVFEAADGFGGGVVEYGAHYKTPEEGAALAKIRAEERQVANQDFTGKSDLGHLAAGGRCRISGHARIDDGELLLTDVEHHVKQTVKMMGADGGDEPYRNTFRVVRSKLTYRPPRQTPRPRIHGVVTALVEPDPSGEVAESAILDTEGRYTVKFYFDAGDVTGRSKSSRPVRMIQAHAGPSYGIHFPLKPGVEVLIVFVDGDPDRPLIVGSVPNPATPSPVVQDVSLMNRIETTSGLLIEMRDAVPPLAK